MRCFLTGSSPNLIDITRWIISGVLDVSEEAGACRGEVIRPEEIKR